MSERRRFAPRGCHPGHDVGVHLPGRAEIADALVAEYQATASQISNVVAQVYLFRTLALAVPVGAVIGNVQALASVRPIFFGGLIALLVALVAWQIVTGWVGTFQAWRGRGDMVMGTFLVVLMGASWAFPRRGSTGAN